ncbi:MAG: helix-turn-helix transcriptional regulator [Dyadobacter sp.]|uniref:helix-turn-helix domain-containing protein n=1 Tax=Dyadobacter sp. TaxID=1914288 RepID=UPI001B291826|nr:AraC family transcriptional regulator [Dyadobacter sp.]MBO9616273.1 helix-turn-helix transcriptional regulator [Dyadobacter sp.]
MIDLKSNKPKSPIAYSCYFTRNREGEQFAPEHVFSYQISGSLTINNGEKEYIFKPGDYRFIRRNQLLKFIKQPPADGVFKSVSVYLDQETLRSFAMEHGYQADPAPGQEAESVIALKGGGLLKGFMDSLMPYSEDDQLIDADLQALKLREAIMILLRSSTVMKDILFDFSEPGKIDLEAFMNKNFHFNVQINRFAYLTGRSLATFKRDFEHIFHTSPSRWLQQRRLQEAHYLIKEKGRTASDVYLEIGFEDLSHFSFAFKKMFGVPPSRLAG